MLHGGDQVGAEPALRRLERAERIFRQQAREKLLGQILGLRRRVPLPPDEGVEGKPIGTAQFLQRGGGLLRRGLPGRQHDTPVRRAEIPRDARSGFEILFGHRHALLGAPLRSESRPAPIY